MSILNRVKEWVAGESNPLADLKSARRWVATLPANDAMKVLQELSDALQSLNDQPNLKLVNRLEITLLLDEAGIGPRNRLLREYLSQSRLPSYRENALWMGIHQYWARLAAAYSVCLEQAQAERSQLSSEQLLQFVVRGLHAGRHWIKWRLLRYSTVEGVQWRLAARFFVVAENNKQSNLRHVIYAGTATESTAKNELLKMLLLGVSASDGLLPVQTEIASRIIEFVVAECDWSETYLPNTGFCYNLIGDLPPMRVQGAPSGSGVWRFFGGQSAVESLESIRNETLRGTLKSGLYLGGDYSLRQVQLVVEHLLRYWVHPLPERRSVRESSYCRIEVIHGFAEVVRHFVSLQERGLTFDAPVPSVSKDDVIEVGVPISDQEDTDISGAASLLQRQESWVVQNISTTGLGALVTMVSGDWLRVGQLIALSFQEKCEDWKIAVIRRLHQTNHGATYVGLEILAQKILPVKVHLLNMALQEDEFSLVLDDYSGQQLKILTRVGTLDAAICAELELDSVCSVSVANWVEKGDSFDLAICDKKS